MAQLADGATGTVLTAPSPATSGTTIVLNSGEGARFPAAPFYVIAHPNNQIPVVSIAEKLLVTAVSTDTLTVVRAQGNYTAKSIAVGWRISNTVFQDDFNNASIIQNEVPGGSVNGSNTAFTIASAAGRVTGSLKVYRNGVRLKGSSNDFVETSTGFTMTTAPSTGDLLLVDYIVAGAINNVGTNSLIYDETPTGTVNGSNTAFSAARSYIAGSLEVFINGVKQKRGTHFTETTPSTGAFTMSDAPFTGDDIMINYSYNLNPSGNSDTVDGYHASSTPTANTVLPLDSNATYPQSVVQTSVLGYAQITSNYVPASAASATQVPGLSVSFTMPAGGRRVKISAYTASLFAASSTPVVSIWDGAVGSGTQISQANGIANNGVFNNASAIQTPSAGASKTYNVAVQVSSGSVTLSASTSFPAYLLVEII